MQFRKQVILLNIILTSIHNKIINQIQKPLLCSLPSYWIISPGISTTFSYRKETNYYFHVLTFLYYGRLDIFSVHFYIQKSMQWYIE